MSYSVSSPCYDCTKKETCTDEKDLREAVTTIHSKTKDTGHQGAGQIVLACVIGTRKGDD